jgi:hypothetical protein
MALASVKVKSGSEWNLTNRWGKGTARTSSLLPALPIASLQFHSFPSLTGSYVHYRVEGTRYFQTLPLRASFLRPDKIEVGDFEELDPFAELDDEDEEM